MSWLSENYEKAAIGGAAVIALGLGFLAMKSKGDSEKAYADRSIKQKHDSSVGGLSDLTLIQDSLSKTHEIHQPDVDGRKVNLLTGVNLFIKKGDIKTPVDLLKSPPVHEGMNNSWWLKYRDQNLDIGFEDSPDRDFDKDGFSNREEHDSETDPTEISSHPDLIHKLNLIGVKSIRFLVKPQMADGDNKRFKIQTTSEVDKNKMPGFKGIAPGTDIVFEKPLFQKRFKFIGSVEKKNARGIPETFVEIEDLSPNKKGERYMMGRRGRLEGGGTITDTTAEFSLNALSQAGNKFKVKEGESFSLPFDAEAKKKPYRLKKIDPKSKKLEVEYTDKDGSTKTKEFQFE